MQSARPPRNKPLVTLAEIGSLRADVEDKLVDDREWDARLIKLANALALSPETIGRSRPSVYFLREIKIAWHISRLLGRWLGEERLLVGKEAPAVGEVDAETAAFCMASLGHRFPRMPNSIFTGVQIVSETLKECGAVQNIEPKRGNSSMEDAYSIYTTMRDHLSKYVRGRGEKESSRADEPGQNGLGTINLILTAMLGGGHILLEDYPGTGKTFIVKQLAAMICDDIVEAGIDIEGYRRIQCVPDLMPGDLVGYEALMDGRMVFRKGPIFAYIVLLDEINRATPKVQSAMLEAMAESHVTIGDRTYHLGKLFFVVATQNPFDAIGTFPLPAAQLDRFLFKRRLKPVADNVVEEIIFAEEPKQAPSIVVSRIIAATEAVKKHVSANQEVMGPYLTAIGEVFEKKIKEDVLKEGSKPSPRSLQNLLHALKVIALIRSNGENLSKLTVEPRYVREIACDYFRHRIFPTAENMSDADRDKFILKAVDEATAQTQSGNNR